MNEKEAERRKPARKTGAEHKRRKSARNTSTEYQRGKSGTANHGHRSVPGSRSVTCENARSGLEEMMKQTGILLPVSSLPSRHGVGDLGSFAYEWLERLKKAGITIWQLLPLNPTGYGNSPYQPYSSFAGDEIYISLDELWKEGLLPEAAPDFRKQAVRVDYDGVRGFKEAYFRLAFDNAGRNGFCESEDYREFAAQKWVCHYGVFRAFKRENHDKCWNEWPEAMKFWPEKQEMDLTPYEEEIGYQIFLQYVFYQQWSRIKRYASERNISVMGDVPFYVGVDSQDVWGGKENFLLDADGKPSFIAGVPPDYFSATGQRWGNPIYDWNYMKETGYEFWIQRIGYSQKLFDLVRIDHFRAFDTFWKIPASCPTAMEGEWIEAPGYEVLDTLSERVPGVNLVAEDLGDLRPEVGVLKEHYGLKGMKIQEFTIDADGKYAFDKFQDVENMIIYTGTHDNATMREWYQSLTSAKRRKIRRWLKKEGIKNGSATERLIAWVMRSKAEYAIIPASDFMEEGSAARLNMPGTVGSPNWEWKMEGLESLDKALKKYKKYIKCRSNGQ